LLYEKFKKNVVGLVEAYQPFVGENVKISNAINVIIVVYYLLQKTKGLN
jgi:hypothetical protein